MNIIDIVNRKLCSGCTACVNICPVDAISLEENREGFLTPIVDSNICTECERCIRICPSNSSDKYKHRIVEADTYIVQSRNPRRTKSASGGGCF